MIIVMECFFLVMGKQFDVVFRHGQLKMIVSVGGEKIMVVRNKNKE